MTLKIFPIVEGKLDRRRLPVNSDETKLLEEILVSVSLIYDELPPPSAPAGRRPCRCTQCAADGRSRSFRLEPELISQKVQQPSTNYTVFTDIGLPTTANLVAFLEPLEGELDQGALGPPVQLGVKRTEPKVTEVFPRCRTSMATSSTSP